MLLEQEKWQAIFKQSHMKNIPMFIDISVLAQQYLITENAPKTKCIEGDVVT